MPKKKTTVVVNVEKNLELTRKELKELGKKFKADVVETLEKKGDYERIVFEEITQIIAPPKPSDDRP